MGCLKVILFKMLLLVIAVVFLCNASKRELKVPCPDEDDTVCINCDCNLDTGYSKCRPASACPPPITSANQPIKRKDKLARCPWGPKFTAYCVMCECNGTGRDHCGLCAALPVRREGQPDSINRKLPPITDNRFFHYEINGWMR